MAEKRRGSVLAGTRTTKHAPVANEEPLDVVADLLNASDRLAHWRNHPPDGPRDGESWSAFVSRMAFALARVAPHNGDGEPTMLILARLARQLRDNPKKVNASWVRSTFKDIDAFATSDVATYRALHVLAASRQTFPRKAAELLFRTYSDRENWERSGRFTAELAERIANAIRDVEYEDDLVKRALRTAPLREFWSVKRIGVANKNALARKPREAPSSKRSTLKG